MKKILFLLFFLFIFSENSFSKQRHFLLDRNISNINIQIDKNFDTIISNNIFERLKKNNIQISEDSELKIIIKALDIKSEEKKIVLSEFGEYDIIDHEIIISLKLEIYDKENNLIWNRKVSKLNSQKWIDFSRLRIGSNTVLQGFYVPAQIVVDLKRKYSKEEFINITVLELINSILDNLIY